MRQGERVSITVEYRIPFFPLLGEGGSCRQWTFSPQDNP
jgi:hypothetical protein